MISSPTETVLSFFKHHENPSQFKQSFYDFFTSTTVFENGRPGLVTTVGPDEALQLVNSSPIDFSAVRVEVLAIAETGNKVLTERIDHLLDINGEVLASLPLMGILEVENGKLTAWRDYFFAGPSKDTEHG